VANIKELILVVDDDNRNQKIMKEILEDDYTLNFSYTGESCLDNVLDLSPDLILLDIMMPGVDGFKVCKIIKNTPAIADTPVIFVTAKVDIDSIEEGFKLGAVDYVTKPFHARELKLRVMNHLELYRAKKQLRHHNISLNEKLKSSDQEHYTELELAQKEVISVLSELMESRSTETAIHVGRVADISALLARLDGRLNEDEIKTITLASPLHDIGKVLIDNKILHKEGPLTDREFAVMQKHSHYAYKILSRSNTELIKAASIIAYQHHENFDGSGYPRGLMGENIHIYGRIVAMADVFDALTHKRVYKEAWSIPKVVAYMKENSGVKFEPKLVDIFLKNLEQFEAILKR